jgi:hypothetical protein
VLWAGAILRGDVNAQADREWLYGAQEPLENGRSE